MSYEPESGKGLLVVLLIIALFATIVYLRGDRKDPTYEEPTTMSAPDPRY